MKSFLVLFHGSSGTTWLCDVLGRHPQIYVPGFEPLEAAHNIPMDDRIAWTNCCFSKPRPEEYEDWLKVMSKSPVFERANANKIMESTHAGFKIRPNSIPEYKLAELIEQNETKIVVSYRVNKLKQALSDYRRRFDGKGHLKGDGIQSASYVDPVQLKYLTDSFIEVSTKINQFALGLGKPIHFVSYEDLYSDFDQAMQSLCTFLEVDPSEITRQSKFSKSTSNEWQEAVKNLDELKQYYVGTKYEQYLLF